MALAHAARDELPVLGAEVEHQDGVEAARDLVDVRRGRARRVLGGLHVTHQRSLLPGDGASQPMPTSCSFCSFLPSVMSAGATMTSAFWKFWMVS